MTSSEFAVRPMTGPDALVIASWRYPGEYSFYDADADADDLAELLNPDEWGRRYFAVDDDTPELVGLFVFKMSGDLAEIGLGLRPDLTGGGLGLPFLLAGMRYASDKLGAERFTLSVAAFNRRAISVYQRAEFEEVERFDHATNGGIHAFVRMSRGPLLKSPSDGKQPGLSFGAIATAYENVRPTYPDVVVDWMLPPGARRVIDLGAGTGKLTRALVARGLDVVAVEPSEGMREIFVKAVPGVAVMAGSAEDIPLPDASVDAVAVAQAWHWVDPSRAGPEVARVLRPGGSLCLVWNARDEDEPWVAALSDLLAHYGANSESCLDPEVGPLFGPLERCEERWSLPMTAQGIIDLLASRSYLIALSPEQRSQALEQVSDLLSNHPAICGSDEIQMPYLTRAFRAKRRYDPQFPARPVS